MNDETNHRVLSACDELADVLNILGILAQDCEHKAAQDSSPVTSVASRCIPRARELLDRVVELCVSETTDRT